MSDFKCPECGEGTMTPKVLPTHSTRLGGVPLLVRNAKLSQCGHCGKQSVSAKELKRWRELLRVQAVDLGQIPSPDDVRTLRQEIKLSVSDFSDLLGVTRQTVHAWERSNSRGIQLSPAALLIKTLIEEIQGGVRGCLSVLLNAAEQRGQRINADCPEASRNVRVPDAGSVAPARPAGMCGFAR